MLMANVYHLNDQFDMFDSAYCGLSTELWNNLMFFGLCTHEPEQSAGFFSFDVISKRINHLFSIDDVLPKKSGSLSHGKIHTKLFQGNDEKFYFATHFAYPNCIPQKIQYEGGYLLSYDPVKGLVENYGILVAEEGIVTLLLDSKRMHCYALTTPSFYFVDYDILNKKIVFTCRISEQGSVCRSIGLDRNGDVYGSCEHYRVFRYRSLTKQLEFLETNLIAISDSTNEWVSPRKQGANRVGRSLWRCIEYDEEIHRFIGINASNSKFFEFDVDQCVFRNMGETTSGTYDKVYPTLTFTKLGNDFYYCPADGKFDFQLSEGIDSNCSLVSYNTKTGKLSNLGSIMGHNQEKIYGAASAMCSKEGKLYMLGAVSQNPLEVKRRLLKFENTCYSLGVVEIDLSILE